MFQKEENKNLLAIIKELKDVIEYKNEIIKENEEIKQSLYKNILKLNLENEQLKKELNISQQKNIADIESRQNVIKEIFGLNLNNMLGKENNCFFISRANEVLKILIKSFIEKEIQNFNLDDIKEKEEFQEYMKTINNDMTFNYDKTTLNSYLN